MLLFQEREAPLLLLAPCLGEISVFCVWCRVRPTGTFTAAGRCIGGLSSGPPLGLVAVVVAALLAGVAVEGGVVVDPDSSTKSKFALVPAGLANKRGVRDRRPRLYTVEGQPSSTTHT